MLWLIYHNATGWDYTNFISDVAIEIGLLILRAENVQSQRMEAKIKQDLGFTRKVYKMLKDVLNKFEWER